MPFKVPTMCRECERGVPDNNYSSLDPDDVLRSIVWTYGLGWGTINSGWYCSECIAVMAELQRERVRFYDLTLEQRAEARRLKLPLPSQGESVEPPSGLTPPASPLRATPEEQRARQEFWYNALRMNEAHARARALVRRVREDSGEAT